MMFKEIWDVDVVVPVDHIATDTALVLELIKPSVNEGRSVVVVGIKKAREHSRIGATAALVITLRKKQDESQASGSRHTT